MTDEELADWGVHENELRQAEMADVTGPAELKAAQAACAARRKAMGLSASQAAWWVTVGQRISRGDSLAYAMRKR